jgi:16S rRNA (cytosine967-C5)-methyltransferase
MSRFYSWLNTSKELVSHYEGMEPFASFIKKYFSQHKKYGSKDRKIISQLCYGFFRLGKAFEQQPLEERILLGIFLSSSNYNDILQELNPIWNENITLTVPQKFSFLQEKEEFLKVFPLNIELSNKIDKEAFFSSLLYQPLLFIRNRPGKMDIVNQKLRAAQIEFEKENENCFSITNSAKVDSVLKLNEEAVIQDLNSQKVLDVLTQHIENDQNLSAWDCCAASGGKSILLIDKFPGIELTVSDIRETILRNLRQRFQQARIKDYHSFEADLSNPGFTNNKVFDIVICDAPCSGSGTWGRTPEHLSFFKAEKVGYYTGLQQSIALNASKSVKRGGYFLYITCSVFEKENEGMVNFLLNKTSLQLISQQYYIGYDKKADTLFAALFTLV